MADSPVAAHSVDVSGLTFRYPGETSATVCVDRLRVGSGEFVSLLGASGSGKSTLLRLVAGLLSAPAGTVHCPAAAENQIGMVFQNPNLIPWRTTEQNITLPASIGPQTQTVTAERVTRLLQLVGLTERDRSKRTGELSGGMQMRAALARALVLTPRLLLMDEPFGAVDDLLRMQLEAEVRRIHHQQKLTTLLVTHNIAEAVFMSDRILVLGGSPSAICADISVRLPKDRSDSTRSLPEFHELQSRVLQAMLEGQSCAAAEGASG